MKLKRLILLFFVLLVNLFLLGCGQTGPLYLPPPDYPGHHTHQ